jgi:glucokinase
MILAGDIGGTKTVLALYDEKANPFQMVCEEVFSSKGFLQFDLVLSKFLENRRQEEIRAICLGVAGPIQDGQCKTTNLPWHLSESKLANDFCVKKVRLLNDLEAAAFGMIFLNENETVTLNKGEAAKGNIAVIAAGTGLGEAFLYWNGQSYIPVASEGGHGDFAPQSDREILLFRYLQKRYGHVSYERILSGPGIFNVYQFLREGDVANDFPAEPDWLRDRLAQNNPSAVIGEVGMAHQDPRCVATLDLFSYIYGAEAGNLALKVLSLGGVYIGGGIAPKLLSQLQAGEFMRGFTQKGRYADLMKSMPVQIALNSKAPLIGAAQYALQMI